MVDALTDNKNRTIAEFRRLFSENGGSVADSGAVNWMFEKVGAVHAIGDTSEDELLENLIEYDIKDIKIDEKNCTIYCDIQSLEAVKNTVEKAKLKIESAGLEWLAKSTIELEEAAAEKVITFLSEIQDHDDVTNVYTNLG
jgi:transcriptional/translational regulatory protein YebC/TACO1